MLKQNRNSERWSWRSSYLYTHQYRWVWYWHDNYVQTENGAKQRAMPPNNFSCCMFLPERVINTYVQTDNKKKQFLDLNALSTAKSLNRIQTDRQADRQTDRQADRPTGRQTHRPTERQTDRQAGRHTDWQVGRQTHIHIRASIRNEPFTRTAG